MAEGATDPLAAEFTADVVLLHLGIPKLDGYESASAGSSIEPADVVDLITHASAPRVNFVSAVLLPSSVRPDRGSSASTRWLEMGPLLQRAIYLQQQWISSGSYGTPGGRNHMGIPVAESLRRQMCGRHAKGVKS